MDAESEKKAKFPWAQVIGIVVVIMLGFYCTTHPNGFFSHLFKAILAP